MRHSNSNQARALINGFLAVCIEVLINGLPGLLGDLEFDWAARLPLAHRGTVDRAIVRRDILNH